MIIVGCDWGGNGSGGCDGLETLNPDLAESFSLNLKILNMKYADENE